MNRVKVGSIENTVADFVAGIMLSNVNLATT